MRKSNHNEVMIRKNSTKSPGNIPISMVAQIQQAHWGKKHFLHKSASNNVTNKLVIVHDAI